MLATQSAPPSDVPPLARYFGITHLRPGQGEALASLNQGQDTLVVMPTGAGKSLIYQLTALQQPGMTLVISPLISLMMDQHARLERLGIPSTAINAELSGGEQARRLKAMTQHAYKLVFVSPERLRSHAFRTAIAQCRISLFAIDEAHCVSQWGQDFRPDYLHLAAFRQQMQIPLALALTATATNQVQRDIVRLLGLRSPNMIITGFNRQNLALRVQQASSHHEKFEKIRSLIKDPDEATLIYVGTRRDAESIAERLRTDHRLNAMAYHGQLDSGFRSHVQREFMSRALPIVVATNAFGLGIDRPDVRQVIHYTMPGTLEAYYQEAGRAGRDGHPATVTLLYATQDVRLHEHFIKNDAPNETQFKALYEAAKQEPTAPLMRLASLANLDETLTRVGLAHLESAGAVKRGSEAKTGELRLTVHPLTLDHLRQIRIRIEVHRATKTRALTKMVHYSESPSCRRQLILEHFGDSSTPIAPVCCDHCHPIVQDNEAPTRSKHFLKRRQPPNPSWEPSFVKAPLPLCRTRETTAAPR